jgi:hypothetical protein
LIGKRLGGAPGRRPSPTPLPTTPPTVAMPGKRSSLIHRQWPRLDSNQSGLSQAQLAPNTLQYNGNWARSGACGMCRSVVDFAGSAGRGPERGVNAA